MAVAAANDAKRKMLNKKYDFPSAESLRFNNQ
jgi:hypothetical protein